MSDPAGERSAVWRLWTRASTNDVYLAARSVASKFKVSLHASGRWRIAFADPASPFVAPGADRAVEKWVRPAEMSPGWTRAFSIAVPASEVVPPRVRVSIPGVAWFPKPPAGSAWNFDLFVAAATADTTSDWLGRNAMGTSVAHRAPLASGEVAVLLAHTAVMEGHVIEMIADHKRTVEEAMGTAPPGVDVEDGDPRGWLIGKLDEDQTPFFIDIAVRTPSELASDNA